MHAVVIYESMFGNTRKIAEAIGEGLRERLDVDVLGVGEAGEDVVARADLLVVGGPTHAHGMSRAATRRGAAQTAGKAGSGVRLEPGAAGSGLRAWMSGLGRHDAKAAAFDTRMRGPAILTGRASQGVGRKLRDHGFDLVTEPESFLVDRQNRLLPDEAARARAWGARLAGLMGRRARPDGDGSPAGSGA